MTNKDQYSESFFKSLNKLTGIPIKKIKNYSKENNPFNILEHPMVLEPSEKQLEKISRLNEFIASYNILKSNEEKSKISFKSTKDSGIFFSSLMGGMKDKERFLVAFLNNSNSLIELKTASVGCVYSAVVYPRDILKMALANDCSRMILAHNHPGCTIEPSEQDKELTQRMVDIFNPLCIKVLDHIIVGVSKYSSMAEDGYLPKDVMYKANYEPITLSGKEKAEDNIKDIEEDEELEM